jgi:hypothetical protein
VLRAKIDMASPNINMRDPVLYRILHATHLRTGLLQIRGVLACGPWPGLTGSGYGEGVPAGGS